jgi:hypothetical protein
MQSKLDLRIAERFSWLLLTSALVFLRIMFPPRGLSYTGFYAALDISLTLFLWLLLIYLHYAIGRTLLIAITKSGNNGAITSALALPIGLGISGSIIGFLGLFGSLSKGVLFLYLGVIVVVLAGDLTTLVRKSLTCTLNLVQRPFKSSGFVRYAKLSAIIIAGLSFANTLVPPWSYDGLMYHLPGPDQFLAAGRIFPNLDNWYVNGPFAIEMLFSIGLALGDAILPKLIHWSFGISLFILTHSFAKRWFDQETAWFSIMVLLTIPIIPIISGFAYIDLAWATFEFAGFACLIEWKEKQESPWLILSGVLFGLAAGSKYLGLMGLATAAIYFAIVEVRRKSAGIVPDLIRFGLPILILGLPWYLKNWIFLGNPFYPLYFGGPGWDQARLDLYMGYLNEFGTGRTLIDFILLPINVYTRHAEFGAVFNRNDIPSVLFPLMIALVFLPKKGRIYELGFLLALRSVFWLIGSHQIRFLLPIYPVMAILTGYSIRQLIFRIRQFRLMEFFFQTMTITLSFITMFYQVQVMRTYNTLDYVAGWQSKEVFLSNASRDFPAKNFLLHSGPVEGKVLLVGDGRNYYCQAVCIPDPDHFRWSLELSKLDQIPEINQWIKARQVSYLLLSVEDINFLWAHDPSGIMKKAFAVIEDYKEAGCLSITYQDDNTILYQVNCVNY